MNTKTISQKDYSKFCVEYFTSGRNKILRFGQAFCNEFNIVDQHLFYNENYLDSIDEAVSKYVEGV